MDSQGSDQQAVAEALTIEKAESILKNVLKTNIVPFLWGPPGIGKSTLIRHICKTEDYDLIDLRLSLLNPVDLRGLPVIDRDNRLAEWFTPAFLPNKKHKKKGILFLDEINLAPLAVQAAAYQLILDKRVGDYTFPSHWRIVAAGNREVDKANVYKLPAPLANRFVHFTIVPELGSWGHWAKENGVREEVTSFIFARPTHLFQMPKGNEKAFPSPRSWSFVSELLNAFEYEGPTDEEDLNEKVPQDLETVIVSAIGTATGKEFIKHLGDVSFRKIKIIIEKFLNTGELDMPSGSKEVSARQAVIQAVLKRRLQGTISDEYFSVFEKQLNAEEKKTIDSFLKENREKIQEVYNTNI